MAAHAVQLVPPVSPKYVPAAQPLQTVDPAGEYMPGMQLEQAKEEVVGETLDLCDSDARCVGRRWRRTRLAVQRGEPSRRLRARRWRRSAVTQHGSMTLA